MALTKVYNRLIAGAPVNVKDFGAVGDGVANDTAAIQAALDSGAKKIKIPSGDYLVGSTISITSPVEIEGSGRVFSNNQITIFRVLSSNVSIKNIEIEGAGNSSYNTLNRLIEVLGTDNGAATAPTRLTNIKIKDCKLHSVGRCGIYAQYIESSIISDNHISDAGYAGIEIKSSIELNISSNFISDISPGTSGNSYGIYLSQTNSADTTRHPTCKRIKVIGNTVKNVEWEGLDCHGGEDILFLNNIVDNCGDTNAAIAIIHADDEVSTPIEGTLNVKIIGNSVINAQEFGIALSAGSSTVKHRNVVISGNTLENCGITSTSNRYGGVKIGAGLNVTVSNNTFDYCAPIGLVIENEYADNIAVTGNIFNRIVSNTYTTPSAIYIDRGATALSNLIVEGNTLALASTGETYESVYGLRVNFTDTGTVKIGKNNFDAAGIRYSLASAILNGASAPSIQFGSQIIAVTTAASSFTVDVTLPETYSGNTLYQPYASLYSADGTSNESTIVQAVRLSTSQIRLVVQTANGSNFAAAGNITVSWITVGA